jgi:hypothetical protein
MFNPKFDGVLSRAGGMFFVVDVEDFISSMEAVV